MVGLVGVDVLLCNSVAGVDFVARVVGVGVDVGGSPLGVSPVFYGLSAPGFAVSFVVAVQLVVDPGVLG